MYSCTMGYRTSSPHSLAIYLSITLYQGHWKLRRIFSAIHCFCGVGKSLWWYLFSQLECLVFCIWQYLKVGIYSYFSHMALNLFRTKVPHSFQSHPIPFHSDHSSSFHRIPFHSTIQFRSIRFSPPCSIPFSPFHSISRSIPFHSTLQFHSIRFSPTFLSHNIAVYTRAFRWRWDSEISLVNVSETLL